MFAELWNISARLPAAASGCAGAALLLAFGAGRARARPPLARSRGSMPGKSAPTVFPFAAAACLRAAQHSRSLAVSAYPNAHMISARAAALNPWSNWIRFVVVILERALAAARLRDDESSLVDGDQIALCGTPVAQLVVRDRHFGRALVGQRPEHEVEFGFGVEPGGRAARAVAAHHLFVL